MRDRILKFLAALDAVLVSQATEGQRLDVYVIGKAAVILFYGGRVLRDFPCKTLQRLIL